MKVEIQDSELEAAIQKAVAQGVESGVGHWEIQKAISESAARAVQDTDIVNIVYDLCTKRIESEGKVMARTVADAIMPSMKEALIDGFREVAVGLIFGIRKGAGAGYMTSDEENTAKAEIRNQLMKKKQ